MPSVFVLDAVKQAFADAQDKEKTGRYDEEFTFFDYFVWRLSRYGYIIVEEGK